MTLKEMLALEVRQSAGEALTDQEEAIMPASRRKMWGQISAFTQPDARSPEQYLEEVEDYLARCSSQMRRTVEWQHVNDAPGLAVAVVNPTDRVCESVQVEIYLPGEVSAIAIGDLLEPMDFLPHRPRFFGEPRLLVDTMAANLFPTVPLTPRQSRWPRINNSRSALVDCVEESTPATKVRRPSDIDGSSPLRLGSRRGWRVRIPTTRRAPS
jgi:hypothetical protein